MKCEDYWLTDLGELESENNHILWEASANTAVTIQYSVIYDYYILII